MAHAEDKKISSLEKIAVFLRNTLFRKSVIKISAIVLAILIVGSVVFVIIYEGRKKEIKHLYIQAFYKYKEIQNEMDKVNLERAGLAIAAMEAVVKTGYRFPEYYLAHYALGNIYSALNKLDLAEKHYLEVKKTDKKFFIRGKAMINLGRIYMNQGKYKEAAELFLETAETENAYKDFAYYLLGICYEKQDNINAAIESYKKVSGESTYKQEATKSIAILERLKNLR